ncbi:MAG: ACT domain-containing protein [Thermodesulfobacteriota bacterium]
MPTKQMVISVMSKDRPGIVADITGVIYELQGDLADLKQSVLCGYFTMILMANFDQSINAEDIIAKFSHVSSETKLDLVVKEIDVSIDASQPSTTDSYVLTAQGENRSGLVYSVGKFCCDHRINILDLATTLADNRYTMVLQLDLSNATAIETVREDLSRFSDESGLSVMMQHNDIFQAVNEIRLL